VATAAAASLAGLATSTAFVATTAFHGVIGHLMGCDYNVCKEKNIFKYIFIKLVI